jgi:hypothetical protein
VPLTRAFRLSQIRMSGADSPSGQSRSLYIVGKRDW